jgi:hypothetical protein
VATSPDTSYDPAGCENQWITQVTSATDKPLHFQVDWAGPELTEQTCEYAYIQAATFGYDSSGGRTNAFWEPLDTVSLRGHWYPVSNNCYFEPIDGGLEDLDAGHPYSAVRVAALAHDVFFSKHRVTAGISYLPVVPC